MFSELRALLNMVSVLCSPCCTFAHQPVGAGRGTRDRRVRPPGGAEAVAGRSHRADNVPRRCVVSGDWLGSLCVVRRCSDVCTPPERGGENWSQLHCPSTPIHLRCSFLRFYIGPRTPLRVPEVSRHAGGRLKIAPGRPTPGFHVVALGGICSVRCFETPNST
jgi:hypothetical protein